MSKPKVICLCGSTRFTDLMLVKQWELTKQGCIVLSWCALPDWYFQGEDKAHIGDQENVKAIVDEVHLRKIDLSDEVFILNVDHYIGESTRRELNYARKQGKRLRFLEPCDKCVACNLDCGPDIRNGASCAVATDDDLVYELEIRGFPEELTKPLRDFLSQPVADVPQLIAWQYNVEREVRG